MKRKNEFEATDCWIWHDEEAELVNREAKEVFSLREALLSDHGIKTKSKFIGMRCERRCCVNPYHVMVCDSSDEYYFDQLTKKINTNVDHGERKPLGTHWFPMPRDS
ncbi:hypothetical protein [Acetobacter lambici]|uniref:hypothetical protein n=1 Tax=Acetobacter lambici TaxID=1332824 RepID=UPI0020A2C4D9|nr:hypothetical protein [Acetobacter lambici]MCP1243950.1 hypothetical protein [Acetobacter lambici]